MHLRGREVNYETKQSHFDIALFMIKRVSLQIWRNKMHLNFTKTLDKVYSLFFETIWPYPNIEQTTNNPDEDRILSEYLD